MRSLVLGAPNFTPTFSRVRVARSVVLGAPDFTPTFSKVRVARSSVFCAVFYGSLFVLLFVLSFLLRKDRQCSTQHSTEHLRYSNIECRLNPEISAQSLFFCEVFCGSLFAFLSFSLWTLSEMLYKLHHKHMIGIS